MSTYRDMPVFIAAPERPEKTFTVEVVETYVTRYTVKAVTEDGARAEAEDLAIENSEAGEQMSCTRIAEVMS